MKSTTALAIAMIMTGLNQGTDLTAQTQESPAVAYPSGYRTWVMVKSSLITTGSKQFEKRGGFHHFFANDKAMEGYRTGKFPDGSVIVDEGVYAKDDNGVANEAALRSVEVMHKDPRYKDTGGWGYERFEGESTTGSGGKAQAACFACHTQVKQRDYVFSRSRVDEGSKKQ
jgi:hypothetical protein